MLFKLRDDNEDSETPPPSPSYFPPKTIYVKQAPLVNKQGEIYNTAVFVCCASSLCEAKAIFSEFFAKVLDDNTNHPRAKILFDEGPICESNQDCIIMPTPQPTFYTKNNVL